VTTGFRRLQESKIRALGLTQFFESIHVDAIDEPERCGKQKLFELILSTHRFRPMEVLVVGDSADAEIEAGNRLGIRTVQTLRPGVSRADNADFHIHSFAELRKLLCRLEISEA
jgi:putative hydrolase of the HAD superfamily